MFRIQKAISDKTLKYESILYSFLYILSIQLMSTFRYQSCLKESLHTISANLAIHVMISYNWVSVISGYSSMSLSPSFASLTNPKGNTNGISLYIRITWQLLGNYYIPYWVGASIKGGHLFSISSSYCSLYIISIPTMSSNSSNYIVW